MLWLLADRSKQFRENVAMLGGMVLFVALNYLGQRFLPSARTQTRDNKP